MDFMETVKAMKEGKKVRNTNWKENLYIFFNEGDFIERSDEQDYIPFKGNMDNNWEIYEEKFCLSDKIENSINGVCDKSDYIYVEDFKQFIQELKKGMHLTLENADIINEIAGDKLI